MSKFCANIFLIQTTCNYLWASEFSKNQGFKSQLFASSHAYNQWIMKLWWYRGSPVSTVFAHPGNRTIDKTVLFGDWFSTKIAIYDFWIFKVPFFAHFQAILIFETKKVIIWFHFETFIELFITNSDIFTRFQTISNS